MVGLTSCKVRWAVRESGFPVRRKTTIRRINSIQRTEIRLVEDVYNGDLQ